VKDLEGKGVKIDGKIDSGVCRMAFIQDPDGNGVTIHRKNPDREDAMPACQTS